MAHVFLPRTHVPPAAVQPGADEEDEDGEHDIEAGSIRSPASAGTTNKLPTLLVRIMSTTIACRELALARTFLRPARKLG